MSGEPVSSGAERRRPMDVYRMAALSGAIVFAAAGLAFLAVPDGAHTLFNALSRPLGLPPAPAQGEGLYLALTAGYMYLVALLALFMYRNPRNPIFPLLLAHGKLASAVFSMYLFATHGPFLIYAANGITDGLIGAAALTCYYRLRRAPE